MKEKKIFKIVMIAVLCLFCLGLAGCTSREVKNVESAINSIGTENQADLSDIRAMYDALADDEKEQIENYSVLIAAENQHAATEVDDMIKSIGRITAESEKIILAARSAYDALNDESKALVGSYDTLTEAELQCEALKVEKYISEINIENIAESGDAIMKAKATYDSLSDESKGYVTNLEDLDRLHAKYVDYLISSIGTVSVDSEDSIVFARKAYEKLSQNGKDFLSSYDLLISSEELLVNAKDQEQYKAIQALLNQKDYDRAISSAEEYYEDRDPREVDPNLIQACIHSYVLKAQEQSGSDQKEAALQTLQGCIDKYSEMNQVSEAENALKNLENQISKGEPRTGAVLTNTCKGGSGKLTIDNTLNNEPVLIKLENSVDDQQYLIMYIRANSTGKVSGINNGNYILKEATGKQWYGNVEMFGFDTSCSETTETLDFETSSDSMYIYFSTYTVTLFKFDNTYMGASEIDRNDF